MNYYQIDFVYEKETNVIELYNKETLDFLETEDKYKVESYFENRHNFFSDIPCNILGRKQKKKSLVDYMDITPTCLSLVGVVSEKVKGILEDLNVSINEYKLKEMFIDGFSEPYYLLFVPLIRNTEYYYPKCIFVDVFDDKKTRTFNNREEFIHSDGCYFLRHVELKDVYKDCDMLNPQNGQLLMSERLIDEFEKRSVSGYKIVTGGCYYETVGFHEPSSGDM